MTPSAQRMLLATGLLIASLAAPGAAHAAETVHLYLNLNGNPVLGESTQVSLGREDSIECVLFRTGLRTAGPTAPVLGGTITIRKRIDKATPFLLEGVIRHAVAEGVFKFFRPNPAGDGTTQQFFTVTGTHGIITSVRQLTPDTTMPASSSLPPMEEVTFQFASISFVNVVEGTQTVWEGKL